MALLDNLIPSNYELQKFEIALKISDSLRIRETFWRQILANADPQNANAQATLAIKTAVETKIMEYGPGQTVEVFKRVLLDSDSTWDTFGVSSINDSSIGMSLTRELKTELVNLLNQSAQSFLQTLSTELSGLARA